MVRAYDVGVTFGYYTVAPSRLTGGSPVVAVEADEGLCRLLERTLRINGPRLGPVHVVHGFASGPDAGSGTVTLDRLVSSAICLHPDSSRWI